LKNAVQNEQSTNRKRKMKEENVVCRAKYRGTTSCTKLLCHFYAPYNELNWSFRAAKLLMDHTHIHRWNCDINSLLTSNNTHIATSSMAPPEQHNSPATTIIIFINFFLLTRKFESILFPPFFFIIYYQINLIYSINAVVINCDLM